MSEFELAASVLAGGAVVCMGILTGSWVASRTRHRPRRPEVAPVGRVIRVDGSVQMLAIDETSPGIFTAVLPDGSHLVVNPGDRLEVIGVPSGAAVDMTVMPAGERQGGDRGDPEPGRSVAE